MEDLDEDGLIADFEVSSHSTETETNSEQENKKVTMNFSSSSSLSTEERTKTTLTEEEAAEEEAPSSAQDKVSPALFNGGGGGQLENAENFEVERRSTVAQSTSPSPKPTDFYIWQPMKPGYAVRLESPGLMALRRRVIAAGPSTAAAGQSESRLRQAIPAMPRLWSVVCCLLNVLLPGLGTVLSGLSILCCSRPRFAHLTRSDVVWTNASVGLLQLATTPLLLFGWVWSVVWAVSFVIVSNKFSGNETSQGDAVVNRCGDHRGAPGAPASVERSAVDSVALGGPTAATRHSIPTTTADLTNSSSQTEPPIIVLHEAPLLVLRPSPIGAEALAPWQPPPQSTRPSADQPMTGSRRSNQGRQNTTMELLQQTDYPEMLLSPGALETIVIHHGAYFIQAQYPPSESSSRTHPSAAAADDSFSATNGGGGGGGGKSTPSFARTMTTTSHH